MDDIIDGPDAAGMATCCDGRRAAETVERLAMTEPRPEDTAILFRRNEEGREFRRRAVAGKLSPHDISKVTDPELKGGAPHPPAAKRPFFSVLE